MLKVPVAFISRVFTNDSMACGVPSRPTMRPPPTPPPATLTRTASGPSARAASMAAATSPSSVVSPPTPTTPSPSSLASSSARSASRSNTTTPIPSPSRRRTVAEPSPPAPPVTMADRPSRFIGPSHGATPISAEKDVLRLLASAVPGPSRLIGTEQADAVSEAGCGSSPERYSFQPPTSISADGPDGSADPGERHERHHDHRSGTQHADRRQARRSVHRRHASTTSIRPPRR